jgi:hypothetical protein
LTQAGERGPGRYLLCHRIEWILADLAITCAAGATTTVYPTTSDEDVAFILADSEAKIVVAEDEAGHVGEWPDSTRTGSLASRRFSEDGRSP